MVLPILVIENQRMYLKDKEKSNARDTTYFTTIYLQIDMALMWQYTTSAIKTPN